MPAVVPSLVPKPWGHELVFANGEHCGKVLHLLAGGRTSWHWHRRKAEAFYVRSGRVRVLSGAGDELAAASSVLLLPGMAFEVPPGLRHRVVAEEESDVFESSTHHDDADTVRVEAGS